MDCVTATWTSSAHTLSPTLRHRQPSASSPNIQLTFPHPASLSHSCGGLCTRKFSTSSRSTRPTPRAGKKFSVRAAADDGSGPLSPESPSGQLLKELLLNHPHLVPTAAEQQLELLAEESGKGGEGEERTGSDLVLYKRIEEVKAQERQRAVEEVIYSLIVTRFIEAGCPLLPQVPFVNLDPANAATLHMMGMIPSASAKSKELEGLHSAEGLEMVREHMERVLGGKSNGIPGGAMMEDKVLVGTSKMRLGQLYAASIMYGYFLKRVDQRFQLEKGMRLMLGGGFGMPIAGSSKSETERFEEEKKARSEEFAVEENGSVADLIGQSRGITGQGMGSGDEKPKSALKEYVSSFDQSALQSAVTVRSKEGISVVERHTEALFGKPELLSVEGGVTVLKDDQTHITVSTLRRLILEAVAFGNFLWDVESFVDSRCKITK